VLPLVKKDGLPEKAREVMDMLKKNYRCYYEEKDTIGRRYRRMDAIGTPFSLTIDYQTLEDNTITIRDRDTMQQERIPVERVLEIIRNNLKI
jgi:glycyl-tRNA synthetase